MKHRYNRPCHALPRFLIAALAILASAQMAFAQTTRPSTVLAAESCVDCHAGVKNYKVVHGPVNVNACDACHKLTDPSKHIFTPVRDKTETCTFCHKLDLHNNPVIHKPVTEGQCLQCHNPHGGKTSNFLRGETMTDLCAKCHKDVTGGKSHVHGPVAAGACASCHQGHSSKFPKLLAVQGRDLCLSCHSEMKAQMAKVKFQHKAVEQDCSICHDAHASNFAMQIKQSPLQLCTSCHEHDKIKAAAMDSTHKHSVVTNDAACLNCHTAHGGDLAKLMRTDQIKVCMKCHDQKIDRGKDVKAVAAVSELLDPKMIKHGPAADGNCGGCHNVHGSNVSRLLKKEYPEVFYQGFALDKYDLCFTCHDKQLVVTEKTTGLTNFRNGEVNLHYLHVNKSDKGRSCRACHTVHASSNSSQIRDSVPYGKWQMPLNFKKAETGGSCSPGCHKPLEYDRVKAVDYDAPAPTKTTTTQPVVAADGKETKP